MEAWSPLDLGFCTEGCENMAYTYFRDAEIKGLDPGLCLMLDRARGAAGIPFIITSGLRTPDQNASLPEAVQDSAHLTGNAVDLACQASDNRFLMIRALILTGFHRIGIYQNHIHADNSPSLPPDVIWVSAGT